MQYHAMHIEPGALQCECSVYAVFAPPTRPFPLCQLSCAHLYGHRSPRRHGSLAALPPPRVPLFFRSLFNVSCPQKRFLLLRKFRKVHPHLHGVVLTAYSASLCSNLSCRRFLVVMAGGVERERAEEVEKPDHLYARNTLCCLDRKRLWYCVEATRIMRNPGNCVPKYGRAPVGVHACRHVSTQL